MYLRVSVNSLAEWFGLTGRSWILISGRLTAFLRVACWRGTPDDAFYSARNVIEIHDGYVSDREVLEMLGGLYVAMVTRSNTCKEDSALVCGKSVIIRPQHNPFGMHESRHNRQTLNEMDENMRTEMHV
jgi:hypothetical protein